ncbi:MAG: alpha/beta fold hydrolase [Pirellulales bacterium]
MNESFPPFRPAFWLRSGHAQTLAALAFLGPRMAAPQRHRVALPDGDAVVLSETCAEHWRAGDRAALLVHGLAGCHESPYMRRIAHKLTGRGVRVFRLDLRGCGAGEGLARLPYHAGLTGDVRAAVAAIVGLCPASPIALVGFSLGGNLVLKLLGEASVAPLSGVDRAVAICPPIDLEVCCRSLDRGLARLYDRHFVSLLTKKSRRESRRSGDADGAILERRPRSLFDFDDCYTAPVSGFESAEHYYRESSAAGFISRIRVPTTVLASQDDPVVPAHIFAKVDWPRCVRLVETTHGGHLGFIGRRGVDADRCWMDWRVVEWAGAGEIEGSNFKDQGSSKV